MTNKRWRWEWRKYRIKYAEAHENDLSEREYHYPDYPVALNRGKFEWYPKYANLILNVKTQERFTIPQDKYNKFFPVDDDIFNWVGRKYWLGHYVCIAHILEEATK